MRAKKKHRVKEKHDRGFLLDKENYLVGNTYLSQLLKSSTQNMSFEDYEKLVKKINPVVNEVGGYIDNMIMDKKINSIGVLVMLDMIYRMASMNYYGRFGKVFNKKTDSVMYG